MNCAYCESRCGEASPCCQPCSEPDLEAVLATYEEEADRLRRRISDLRWEILHRRECCCEG